MRPPLLLSSAWLVASASLGSFACAGESVRLGDGPLPAVDAGGQDTQPSNTLAPSPTASQSSATSVGSTAATVPTAPAVGSTDPSPAPERDAGLESLSDGGAETQTALDSSVDAASLPAGPACEPSTVTGAEVLWIGDPWLSVPDNVQSAVTQQLAREAGTLGQAESHTVRARDGATLDVVVAQYREQLATGLEPRALIMSGGTFETIMGTKRPSEVVSDFERFLQEVAVDGAVEAILYVLVPKLPGIVGVSELDPGLTLACEVSEVECHFLDLGDHWPESGHVDATGVKPNDEGARLIGELIWSAMQQACIAQ